MNDLFAALSVVLGMRKRIEQRVEEADRDALIAHTRLMEIQRNARAIAQDETGRAMTALGTPTQRENPK